MEHRVILAALATMALAMACAKGTSDTGGYEELPGDGGHGATGAWGGQGGTTATGTMTGTTTGTETGGSGGTGATGGTGGTGATGGTGGSGGSCDFTAPNSCHTATELPSVCGDENNDLSSVNGVGNMWREIYVAECVSSIISYPALSYTATLVSPPGMDYDLYIYRGDDGGPDCNASPTKALGNPETSYEVWGDNIGSEDGTWFTLEVRHVSGNDCNAQWTLSVQGNT